MPSEPSALTPGWLFADRFEVREVLGRGGFGIAYLAFDQLRGDLVVVKELAPIGITRSSNGVLRFSDSEGQRLREQFLEEASLLSRLSIPGVPPIRLTFRENGTAYFATDYVPDSQTLDEVINFQGPLSPRLAVDILLGLLDVLESVHSRQILHRDIKPSNVLVTARGEVFLIDFGSAREWHADSTTTHTVLYTPGYAPPEQMSQRARRGPATDLYALSATFYAMVTGSPPPSAADRAAGFRIRPLSDLCEDLDPIVSRTIEKGLSLAYNDRPLTVPEFRDLLAGDFEPPVDDSLTALDDTLLRLKKFSYDRRACPSCKGLLIEPRPLKRGACPVCQSGTIRKREIQDRLCPVCRSGVLKLLKNISPLAICPSCCRGALSYQRRSLVSLEQVATCSDCEARFEVRSGKLAVMEDGAEFHDLEYWRNLSGRSTEIWKCDDCSAQFDTLADSRWAQILPKPTGPHRRLYPEEWSRVAMGLEPGAGNAQCDACNADFYLEKDKITLLDAHEDPHGFAEAYLGRLLTLEHVRWLGAGKTSPNPGLLCDECHTEFDKDNQYLRLVATANRRLARHIDQPKVMEDWHRLAQGLPTIHTEENFEAEIESALRVAYRNGKISFDNADTILWKGDATKDGENRPSTLTITQETIIFGKLFRIQRQPTDALVGVWADDDEIHFQFSGERERVGYRIEQVELVAHLRSGDQTIVVTARDLAARLTAELNL